MSDDMPPEPPPPPPAPPRFDARAAWARARRLGTTFMRALVDGNESPLADLRASLGAMNRRRLVVTVLMLVGMSYLLTGVYVVAPGEVGVVRRFGAVVGAPATPGLHYRMPWPVERVDLVNVSEVRRETVGTLEPEADHEHPEPPAMLQALSGDTNVIDIEIVVQYQVRNAVDYLTNVQYAPYRLVRDTVRQAVTLLVTQLPVDDILTSERQALQSAIRAETQRRLDAYGSGLVVVAITLQKAYPPAEVADAFTDVNSAREDATRAVNEAAGYANSLIPEARGQAEQIQAGAQAYRSDTLGSANGATQGFEAVLAEYQANAQIYGAEGTRYRLYLETIEKILPQVRVYAVDTANGNTINLRLFGSSSAPQTPAP